jgi:TrpR-related protein YerC/YecD
MKNWDNDETEDLLRAIVALESTAEAKKFLRDLLTDAELIEIGKRWRVAQMLSVSVPYSQILQATGLSTTTIARISKWLTKGTGGYKLMLERMGQPSFLKTEPKTIQQKPFTKKAP